jgi:hypothetical protein
MLVLVFAEIYAGFMSRRGILALIFALVFALLFGAYLLGNSKLELQGSSLAAGSLKVETELPQATCSKVLTRDFPFVKLNCEQKAETEESDRQAE